MTPGEIWRRLHYLLHRSRRERELEEEMSAHRAMQAAGGSPFGNAAAWREASRDVWGWGWWDRLCQDVTFGARLLRRSPAFTMTAVAVLAIGAGLNITVFQVFNMAALSPLPVADPDSLVRFHRRSPTSTSTALSYPAMRFYAEHNTVLAAAMAVHETSAALDDDLLRETPVQFVSANYLAEIGARPLLGRLFDPARDDGFDGDAPIVVSEDLWRRRLGADSTAIGRAIRVNGRAFTLAGVLPSSFVGLTRSQVQAWMPIARHGEAFPGSRLLTDERDNPVAFFGRLGPGVSRRAAEDGLRATAAAFVAAHPDGAWRGEWLAPIPAGRFTTIEQLGPALLAGGTLTTIVLLAACANLATLLLARGFHRSREISIRLSVGATRRRLVRQLLTESAMIAGLGGLAGLAVSFAAARLLLTFTDAPAYLRPAFDVRVALFSFGLAALSSALVGLAPALQAVKPAAGRGRARSLLVGAQVAAGCTLLVVAALLVRGLDHLARTPLGFDYADHVTLEPALNANGFTPEQARDYWQRLGDGLAALPAVRGFARDTLPPLGNRVTSGRLKNGTIGIFHQVDPAYFPVMGIPFRRGRNFQPGERGVAIVSESFAASTWPGEEALGQRHGRATVVGVVGNARTAMLPDGSASEFYEPLSDAAAAQAVLIVRADGDPSRLLGAIAGAARAVDPRIRPGMALLTDSYAIKTREPRRLAVVMSVLGGTALALAAIGLAGLAAFAVSQRGREIAVRIALGAGPAHVIGGVVGQFLPSIAGGLVCGLAAAAGLSLALRRALFGLSHLDPVSYLASVVLFVAVAGCAAAPSLRRALRVDPVAALRSE